jgi:hypothetical protein
MTHCKTHFLRLCLFLLASVPAYCQRGTIAVNGGQISDSFGGQAATTAAEVTLDGQLAVYKSNPKTGGFDIVAGGEVRLPSDSSNHATELAVFGGPTYPFRNFTIGFDAQVHRIYLPSTTVNNQILARGHMSLLELPLVIKYNFGPGKRYFVQAQGAPEFSPRWHKSAPSLIGLPNPSLDHGYFVRGSAGYSFGKWFVKATYENRYFSFVKNPSNPDNLYNWRSVLITGGIGLNF